MGLSVEASECLGECCFCGTLATNGRSASVDFNVREVAVSFYGKTPKERQLSSGQAICEICFQYWAKLEHKVGRDVDAGEFAIWAIGQVGKKTKAGMHFAEGGRRESQVDVYGELFGDFAKLIFEEAGLSCRITCPSCGEEANVEKSNA